MPWKGTGMEEDEKGDDLALCKLKQGEFEKVSLFVNSMSTRPKATSPPPQPLTQPLPWILLLLPPQLLP